MSLSVFVAKLCDRSVLFSIKPADPKILIREKDRRDPERHQAMLNVRLGRGGLSFVLYDCSAHQRVTHRPTLSVHL
jgi:hypothetical protein